MTDSKFTNKITSSKNNLKLYGFKDYFSSFAKLYEHNKLPHTIMLSGQRGIGKSTFVYHFVNFIFSKNEHFKYSYDEFLINENNPSYQFLNNKSHTNFFLLDTNDSDESIKIEQVRSLSRFLNKSTYLDDLKIVLIDNAELLNKNSSNALLKELEEPRDNTYFFIINNNSKKILKTIKSRCVEFKFIFSFDEKKEILNKLLKDNNFENSLAFSSDLLNNESHGSILRLISMLVDSDIKTLDNYLSVVLFFMEELLIKKNNEFLPYLSLFIELHYNKLTFEKISKINIYNYNKIKILKLINNFKIYNLDKKNLHTSIGNIIYNG
jgi:DNA polymerase III subunit delta'